MPQVPVNKEYNTFVKGLITEAGPLTFPENASIDEDNFELNIKGSRSRRLGLDYETSFSLIDTGIDATNFSLLGVSCFKWESVNTDGDFDILVVQTGNTVSFFDATAQPITGARLNGGADVTLEGDSSTAFQYSTISGNLIVVTGIGYIYQVFYDPAEDKITYVRHGLLVRDIWGVDDGREITERTEFTGSNPGDNILYNLNNQGWWQRDETIGYLQDMIINQNLYPSNADKPSSGIDSTNTNSFNTALVRRAGTGTTPAPKGSHIIDAFERGASRSLSYPGLDTPIDSEKYSLLSNYTESGLGWRLEDASGNKIYGAHDLVKTNISAGAAAAALALPIDRTEPAIRAVASYAGRVFYAGFSSEVCEGDTRSPNLSTYICYSQIVDDEGKVGKCYQEGDPASINDFDIVATDGGTLKIPGVGKIIKLESFGPSLLVFASNGVWEIRGGESGFSATDQQVIKVTSTGAISSNSIVDSEDKIIFWADSGIYALVRDTASNNMVLQSLTDTTIRTLYSEISVPAKRSALGIYDKVNKRVQWLYNDEATYDGNLHKYRINRQLTLDLNLGAFFTYTFVTNLVDTEYPVIASAFNSPNFISDTYEDQVIVNGDEVQVNGDDVVISARVALAAPTRLNYLTIKPQDAGSYQYTLGTLNNPNWEDWASDDSTEEDTPAYIETGYEILGDSQRQKQATYITSHFERTETGFDVDLNPINEGSCMMQAKWDFADNDISGKITDAVQVYRLRKNYIPSGSGDSFTYGQSVISTKSRIRGRGKSLTLRFSTEEGKACTMYGWGTNYKVNQDV